MRLNLVPWPQYLEMFRLHKYILNTGCSEDNFSMEHGLFSWQSKNCQSLYHCKACEGKNMPIPEKSVSENLCSLSKIYKPILQMMKTFAENPNANIEYILYMYFPTPFFFFFKCINSVKQLLRWVLFPILKVLTVLGRAK